MWLSTLGQSLPSLDAWVTYGDRVVGRMVGGRGGQRCDAMLCARNVLGSLSPAFTFVFVLPLLLWFLLVSSSLLSPSLLFVWAVLLPSFLLFFFWFLRAVLLPSFLLFFCSCFFWVFLGPSHGRRGRGVPGSQDRCTDRFPLPLYAFGRLPPGRPIGRPLGGRPKGSH